MAAVRYRLDQAPLRLYPNRQGTDFSTGLVGFPFMKTKAYAEATIVHLHWVNGGFIGLRDLKKVKKPLLWTLRDMWPMTGGCHYSLDCRGFTDTCGSCPQLGSTATYDLSKLLHSFKRRYIPQSMTVVGISEWLSDQARSSAILQSSRIRTIPNNVDVQEFRPVKKEVAREVLGLDTKKRIVLLGAQWGGQAYKGFDKAMLALRHLSPSDYLVCLFGRNDSRELRGMGFECLELGFLHDTTSLRLAYAAADVFLAPSVTEAFGKTVAEAMACGTPVVCFDATGPRDIVDHLVNGYRAMPFDPRDLANGIKWVAQHRTPRTISQLAREKIARKFDTRIIAKKYVALYQELLREARTDLELEDRGHAEESY